MKMTVEAATRESIQLVAVALAATAFGSLVVRVLSSRMNAAADKGGFNPIAAMLASLLAPAQALLPFYAVA